MSKVKKFIVSAVYGDETGTARFLVVPLSSGLRDTVKRMRKESRRLGKYLGGSTEVVLSQGHLPVTVISNEDDKGLPHMLRFTLSDYREAGMVQDQSGSIVDAFERMRQDRIIDDRHDVTPVAISGVEISVQVLHRHFWSVYIRFRLRHGDETLESDDLANLFEKCPKSKN